MKKYMFGIIGFLFVIAASAYTIETKSESFRGKPLVQEWFVFDGVAGEENIASKYHLVTTEPDCEGGSNRCAVYAQRQTGSNPAIPDLNMQYDIFTKP